MSNLVRMINDVLKTSSNNQTRDYSYFHCSEFTGCQRKTAYLYYRSQGLITIDIAEPQVEPRLQRIFDNGHYVHDRLRKYMDGTGRLRGWWRCLNFAVHSEPKIYGDDKKLGVLKPEKCDCGSTNFEYVEIHFHDPETNLGGSVDTVLLTKDPEVATEADCIIVDYKSMNHFSFSNLSTPTDKHIDQMQLYIYLSGLKAAILLYEDKNDQNLKQFLVERDDDLINRYVANAKELRYVLTHTKSNGKHALPRRSEDYSPAHRECRKCQFRSHCYNH